MWFFYPICGERMLAVMVHVFVKPGMEAAFEAASLENAKNSRLEPGIAQFDVLRDRQDPSKFLLVEVYRHADAPTAHKETPHYKKWRESVEPLMAQPRQGVFYDVRTS
jgi:quinol monooxygenase YgiN